MILNYVIIDDEPIVHTLIRQFADDLGTLLFFGFVFRASESCSFIYYDKVYLMFFDILMSFLF